jgi:hypothetical protein
MVLDAAVEAAATMTDAVAATVTVKMMTSF